MYLFLLLLLHFFSKTNIKQVVGIGELFFFLFICLYKSKNNLTTQISKEKKPDQKIVCTLKRYRCRQIDHFFFFSSLCFVIATKKRNKLQLSRFISRSTGRNINQHLAARQSEREREREREKKK
jgi:hypothetical protein